MKHVLLLSVLGIGLLSSCSTAFKAGQTPDDVYYSPGREVASVAKEDEIQRQQSEEYQIYLSSLDDRYLRMKIANRYRWSAIDDYSYWYDSRYDFGVYNPYNYYTRLNPYAQWNPYLSQGYGNWGWSSPIYTVIHYSLPKIYGGGSTSGSNIYAFRNKGYSNTNLGYTDPKTGKFTPSGGNNSFGDLLKRVFTGSSSSSGNVSSYDRPVRTFNSSPSNSSSQPAPSSNAGGNSGGFKSTGSSTGTGRGGRG